MNDIGFISASNGWVLNCGHKATSPQRYHLAPDTLGYDLHADYIINGKHVSKRKDSRDQLFLSILESVDNGEIPSVTLKFKKRYPLLKLPLNEEGIIKEKEDIEQAKAKELRKKTWMPLIRNKI